MILKGFWGVYSTIVGLAILTIIAVLLGSSKKSETDEQFQRQQAKVSFARNLCARDCFPGTLESFDYKQEICTCYPPPPGMALDKFIIPEN